MAKPNVVLISKTRVRIMKYCLTVISNYKYGNNVKLRGYHQQIECGQTVLEWQSIRKSKITYVYQIKWPNIHALRSAQSLN